MSHKEGKVYKLVCFSVGCFWRFKMAYVSGKVVVDVRVGQLERELKVMKSAVPVYDVVEAGSYGLALVALREAYARGKAGLQPVFEGVVRPLSFEETIDCVVNAYESGDKRLLNRWNDSCTGVVHKNGSFKFKVVPVCRELVFLGGGFVQPFVSVDYDTYECVELDSSRGKYNVPLLKKDVLGNGGWLAALNGNKPLLRAFRDIVFSEFKVEKAMSFNVFQNMSQDVLRVLAVGDIYYHCNADDRRYLLYGITRFVRVAQK
jgi:hypothetical protein